MKIIRAAIAWRDLAPVWVIVSNSLVWYTVMFSVFSNAVTKSTPSGLENSTIFITFCLALVFSALYGATMFTKSRDSRLLIWMAGGIIASGLSIAVIYNNMFANVLVSIVLGISAGIGLPSCLACFADITHIENRGLYGGIVWSTIGISTLVLVVLLTPLDAIHSFAALALWRTLGLIAFYSLSRRKREVQLGLSSISYGSIINKRAMILYLLPWIMFSLVNFIEAPVLENIFGELVTIIGFVEFGLSSISAIIGGFLSDIVGRKRVVIAGFIMLGVEYAVLGLYRQMEFSRYVYMVFDGFTWGMFASVFFMTIWGDLGEYSQKDKFYAIGGLPYLLATFLPILIRPYVGMMEPVASFSLASFFLFSAVFPLMYAPETLSEKKIKEFELRSYIKKAKKLKERLD